MTISHKVCSRCDKPVSLQVLPSISGTKGAYKMRMEGISAMICGENHKRFVYPNLAMRLMDHIFDPNVSKLYVATQRGFFKKRAHCAKCETEIPAGKPDIKEYRITVPLPDIQSVTVTLIAPILKCAKCGTEQLPDSADLLKYAFKAMTHAFRSAEIHAE